MQMTNKETNIFSEDEVFNYVAGQLSDTQRIDFEKRLAVDETLQEAVAAEKHLRQTLRDFEDSDEEPEIIKRASVNDLLTMLELDEVVSASSDYDETLARKSKVVNWYSFAGVAASLAFVAIVLFNYQADDSYRLRSEPADLSSLNFSELVTQRRIAQVWFSESLSADEILALLDKHNLTPISRAGSAWVVASQPVLSESELAKLKKIEGFIRVSRISYSD